MERLTYSGENIWEIKGIDGTPCDEVCENRFLSGCHDCPIQTAFDRLAAYEDTGLEPEKISEAYSKGWQSALNEIAYAEQDGTVLVEIPILEEYIKLGTLDHLRELTQAEKDGRLVVLPCKKGDTLASRKDADMDRKELIEKLRGVFSARPGIYLAYLYCEEAATAIETLLAERDAAIKDVWKAADYPCRYCAEWEEERCSRPGQKDCAGANWWKWRGPQKEGGGDGQA